jgi:2,4-dienoyl-CoA reductase-like NADH-dependent reductase (Old Yellow Enzyme family)/thioredoxin reductase
MKWKLLEPITIGNKLMRNRIIMPAMETRMSTISGDVKPEMIDYYAARARGGAGAIIVENTYIDDLSSRSSLSSSGLYSDHLITGKNLLAEVIKEGGALAIIQLSHGGRQSIKSSSKYEPVAPSLVMCSVTKRMPRELTIREIIKIEDAFAEAAFRAKQAGFDGVEVHGAHGYLICSFLSPLTNLRTDKYGGGLENRGRFAKNIIRKIRDKVGVDFMVGYRISASEYIKGGLEIEEACSFVKSIQNNIDYINVSAGIYESPVFRVSAPTYVPPGELIPLAREMKKNVNIPVIAVGSFNPKLAEQVLKQRDADIIAFGRALIADPQMPNKLKDGREADVRPCIRGNEGCVSRFKIGCSMRCEVNPACGREAYLTIRKTKKPKKILVVGGGVSGMEAARVADLMSHSVILVEKEDKLGGHLIESTTQEFKINAFEYLTWLKNQLKKSRVRILLNTNATPALIKQENPDALVIAIGSEYIYPDIKGAENALIAGDVLKNISIVGKRVIVIGGGLVGSETALALAIKKHKVIILEMTDIIAERHEPVSREAIIRRLQNESVDMFTNHTVMEIGNGYVVAEDKNGNSSILNADTVVLATGLKSRKTSELTNIIPNTVCIGDCVEARKIYYCVHEAWNVIINIISREDILN